MAINLTNTSLVNSPLTNIFPGNPLNPDDNCEPYETDLDTDKVFAPCGLIANSMFNGSL